MKEDKDLKLEDFKKEEYQLQELRIQIYQKNVFLRRIYDGIPIKYGWVFGSAIFILIIFLGYVLCSVYDGAFYILPPTNPIDGARYVGFIQDFSFLVLFAIMFIILLLFKSFFDQLSTIFIKICTNDIIDESKYSLEKFKLLVKECEIFIVGKDRKYKYELLYKNKSRIAFYAKSSIFVIFFLFWFFTILIGYYYPNPLDNAYWQYQYHATTIWGNIPFGLLITVYLVSIALWSLIGTVICVRRVISELSINDAIKLRPLSPDRAAGLKPIGTLTLNMIYIIAAPMVALMVYVFYSIKYDFTLPFLQILLVIFYFILVILIFFLPLGTAHDIMVRAKENELKILCEEFNQAYEIYKKETKSKTMSTETLKAMEVMQSTGVLYDHVERMAVWPFDISIIIKFIVTIFAPFLFIALQLFLERVI